jgi:glycosyltransferase involved in cell wall biosynthesis
LKKILLINVYGGIGGAGQSFLDIVDSIDQTKFQLVVYSPATPSAMTELLKARGIEVITSEKPLPKYVHYSGASVTKLNLLFFWRSISILMRGIPELKRIILQVKPDYVAVNSMTHAWVGPRIGKGIVKICFVRETYLNTPLNLRTNLLKHWLVRHFDKVVFISDYDMRNTKGLKANQGIVIRDSIKATGEPYDTREAKEKLNLNTADKHVLFMGGFDRIKGGDVLMKAMSQIKDDGIKVLFLPVRPAGTSTLLTIKTLLGLNYEKRIRNLIERYNLENKILMYPPQSNMDDFYKAADVVVFPSKYPHQARPVFEAGVMRKTIVISRFEATGEHVKDNYNGLYFTPGDANDLARCILQVLKDDSLRKLLEDNNYTEAMMNHNLLNFSKKIDAVFNEFYDDTGRIDTLLAKGVSTDDK